MQRGRLEVSPRDTDGIENKNIPEFLAVASDCPPVPAPTTPPASEEDRGSDEIVTDHSRSTLAFRRLKVSLRDTDEIEIKNIPEFIVVVSDCPSTSEEDRGSNEVLSKH